MRDAQRQAHELPARSVPAAIWATTGVTEHMGGLRATQRLLALCEVGQGQAIIDIGCGTGGTACYLARAHRARVTAMDLSARRVADTRRRAAAPGLSASVAVVLADAQELPCAAATFDVAVLAYVGDALCGEGRLDKALRYAVKVRAASAQETGCGTPGARVSLRVNGRTVADVTWDNEAPHPQELQIVPERNQGPSGECREIITDPGFEADGGWKAVPGHLVALSDELPHNGLFAQQLKLPRANQPGVTYAAVQQAIRIPTGAGQTTLSFWYRRETPATDVVGLRVLINQQEVWRERVAGTRWVRAEVDLTPYRFSDATIVFEGYNIVANTAASLYLDDVSIQACR